jgi:hypothetical protein
MMTAVTTLWLVGLACLVAAVAGQRIKVGSIHLPALDSRASRVGVAAVGVMSLLLGGVLFTYHDPAGATPTAHETGSGPSAGVPADAGTTTDTGAAPTRAPATVLWHGSIRLRTADGVDVSTLPVIVESFVSQTVSSFYAFDGKLRTGGDNALSEWSGATTPAADQCADQLRTHPTAVLTPHTGLGFCTAGVSGPARVAFGRMLSYNDTTLTAEIDLTVWSLNF